MKKIRKKIGEKMLERLSRRLMDRLREVSRIEAEESVAVVRWRVMKNKLMKKKQRNIVL